MDKNTTIKRLCKECGKHKPYADFEHKYFRPTICVECHRKRRKDRYKKNAKRNATEWMDVFIGRS
jgi:hypothetical protein